MGATKKGLTGTQNQFGSTSGNNFGKTVSHQQLKESVESAQFKKNALQTFCFNNGYKTFDDLNRILEVFYEQGIAERLSFPAFARFVRVDESKENQAVFKALAGDKKKIDSKILILQLLNCITSYPREQKLLFAFNLFDEEESKFISIGDLQKILQANYFAPGPEFVQNKAKIILDQARNSSGTEISYDDFVGLTRKYQALFYPLNIK